MVFPIVIFHHLKHGLIWEIQLRENLATGTKYSSETNSKWVIVISYPIVGYNIWISALMVLLVSIALCICSCRKVDNKPICNRNKQYDCQCNEFIICIFNNLFCYASNTVIKESTNFIYIYRWDLFYLNPIKDKTIELKSKEHETN